MKFRILFIIFIGLMFGFTSLSAQNSNGQFQMRGATQDSPGRIAVNQSSRLEILNQGSLFFDIDLINKTSVLYMGNSPVYTFSVRVVKPSRRDPRFRGREYVLRGNTNQRVIIDENKGVVFLKIKKRNGGVQKLIISRISVQQFPNQIRRINLNNNVNLAINLNYNNGNLSSTVAFKGVPIFIMQTGYEMYQGRRNLNVLRFKGNSSGELFFNRSNQTIYYKSPKRKGVWTKVKRIRR